MKDTLIDRLMTTVSFNEKVHELFDYENAFEGRAQRIYNAGVIWGLKHVLIAVMDYSNTQTDKEIHARLTDELKLWNDQQDRFSSYGRFESLDEELDGEGNVEGFRHMVKVIGAYIEDKELVDVELLSLVEGK